MKRFISFGSIEQFRGIMYSMNHVGRYIGLDENGDAQYDANLKLPTVHAIATEKIHGTNASVCYSNPDGFWVQSRKNIITVEKDNAATAFLVYQHEDKWMELIHKLADSHDINLDTHIISLFYEASGGNIQKNSALSGFDKKAMIFQHFKVSPLEHQDEVEPELVEDARWYTTTDFDGNYVSNGDDILNIMHFPYYEFDIDFNSPNEIKNYMVELVDRIEPNSPVGQQLGKQNNIGEGIVVTFMYNGALYRFKVKGEKHSSTKVKTLKPVNLEKEQAKIDFANYACSASRLEQAWQTVFGIENELNIPHVKFTGDFLRAVINDVLKEELDVMAEKNLEPKSCNPIISKVARGWFMEQLDNHAFNS